MPLFVPGSAISPYEGVNNVTNDALRRLRQCHHLLDQQHMLDRGQLVRQDLIHNGAVLGVSIAQPCGVHPEPVCQDDDFFLGRNCLAEKPFAHCMRCHGWTFGQGVECACDVARTVRYVRGRQSHFEPVAEIDAFTGRYFGLHGSNVLELAKFSRTVGWESRASSHNAARDGANRRWCVDCRARGNG
jgi:hypothetical protein